MDINVKQNSPTPSSPDAMDQPQLTPEQRYFAEVLGRALARMWHFEHLPVAENLSTGTRRRRAQASGH
jgi:hypothetical protein